MLSLISAIDLTEYLPTTTAARLSLRPAYAVILHTCRHRSAAICIASDPEQEAAGEAYLVEQFWQNLESPRVQCSQLGRVRSTGSMRLPARDIAESQPPGRPVAA